MGFAFSVRGLAIRPGQIKSEITKFLRVAHAIKPTVILEIGTGNGGTLFLFSRISSVCKIITVRLSYDPLGADYSKWRTSLYKLFQLDRQTIFPLEGNSHASDTHERVVQLLAGQCVDLLFIDGDHTLDGVKRDFEMYGPLVRKGGIIAFHDIVAHPPEMGCHVDAFWNEIKQKQTSVEIVEAREQGWGGIGMFQL
ncbi:MAG TPA: class I SAM-dependent methyltransferase [Candidatus Bathyarchaeia archaeon]|nr:class I SAM-dependent methyltransferase [Candidatus Bathyarchaeia archaeon]